MMLLIKLTGYSSQFTQLICSLLLTLLFRWWLKREYIQIYQVRGDPIHEMETLAGRRNICAGELNKFMQ